LAKRGVGARLSVEGVTTMVTQNVSPSVIFDDLTAELVKSGRYANADAVLRAATQALKREECDDAAKLAMLIEALEAGEASGEYEGDPFETVRRKMGWESDK